MKTAIFDFDGTLFQKDTLRYLLSCWKNAGYSRFKYYKIYISLISLFMIYKIRIKLKIPSLEFRNKALESFNHIFRGMNQNEIDKYFNICALEIMKSLNPIVVKEVHKAKKDGYHLILLSGTYELFLDKIADQLEIDSVIGTKIYFCNGIFDKYKKLNIISGYKKLEQFNRYYKDTRIDLELSVAYANSYSDIYILEAVGIPVVVNPDDKLKELAIEKKWRIIT